MTWRVVQCLTSLGTLGVEMKDLRYWKTKNRIRVFVDARDVMIFGNKINGNHKLYFVHKSQYFYLINPKELIVFLFNVFL